MSAKEFYGNISHRTRMFVWLTAAVSSGLGVYSCVMPPQGVVDRSVIEFAAVLSIYPLILAAYEAIREGRGVKYTHGDTVIEVGKDGEKEN